MPWTWVADDFNRSDRPLHGDNVGTSSLVWASYRRDGGSQAAIVSNAPVPVSTGDGLLLTDVEALAGGSTILGVGSEVKLLTKPSSPNFSLFGGIPPEPGGQGIWFHTNGVTGTLYLLTDHKLDGAIGGLSVGSISVFSGTPTATSSGETALTPNTAAAAPTTGDVMRLEVVFGGSTTVYKNGTSVLSASTPAALTASHTLAGASVNDIWYSDDWRVGVLT